MVSLSAALLLCWRSLIRLASERLTLLLDQTVVLLSSYQENFVTTNPVHILRRVRFFNKILDSSQVGKLDETSQAVGPRSTDNIK